MGIPLDPQGWPVVNADGETSKPNVFLIGDVQRGPSSIVSAIGNARRATDVILARENIASRYGNKVWNNVDPAKVYQRKGAIAVTTVDKNQREAFVEQEASRCPECNYVCSKCVDVCRTAPIFPWPSRASRIASRPCIWTLIATNAATALSSARGRKTV